MNWMSSALRRYGEWVARVLVAGFVLAATLGTASVPCGYALEKAQAAPRFVLTDLQGVQYDLATFTNTPLLVVCFFDAQSRPSQEGLVNISLLAQKYKDTGLIVWGVTRSPRDKVADFASKAKLSIPILLDTAKVSERYQTTLILPTICAIGPEHKVLEYFQGGGKNLEVRLASLCEKHTRARAGSPATGKPAASSPADKTAPKPAGMPPKQTIQWGQPAQPGVSAVPEPGALHERVQSVRWRGRVPPGGWCT